MQRVKDEFKKRYKMKDLGEASEFLGMHIVRNRATRTLQLTQSNYVDKILERFRMTGSKSVDTPMMLAPKLAASDSEVEDPPAEVPYREAIGCLIWLMIGTRPDIGFAVGRLSQHCENPLTSHWTAVKRVLRYLKGTRDTGIAYGTEQSLQPVGYCDSDWASCRESRKSTEGFVFLLAGGAVSWRSKKQSIVATSSCEAEYIALTAAGKEAIWLSRMLAGMLGKAEMEPITVFVDNQGAIDTAKNATINRKNKHIDIRYHYVREAVGNNQVMLKHCSSNEQVADPLTKPLLRISHRAMCDKMGLRPNGF